jgi:uncharacterized protein (DUF1499 family)
MTKEELFNYRKHVERFFMASDSPQSMVTNSAWQLEILNHISTLDTEIARLTRENQILKRWSVESERNNILSIIERAKLFGLYGDDVRVVEV